MVGQSRGAGQHLGIRASKPQCPRSARRPWHFTSLCGSSGTSPRLGLSLQSRAQVQPSRTLPGLPWAGAWWPLGLSQPWGGGGRGTRSISILPGPCGGLTPPLPAPGLDP